MKRSSTRSPAACVEHARVDLDLDGVDLLAEAHAERARERDLARAARPRAANWSITRCSSASKRAVSAARLSSVNGMLDRRARPRRCAWMSQVSIPSAENTVESASTRIAFEPISLP